MFLGTPPCGKLCMSFSICWTTHHSDMQRISYGRFSLKCHDVSETASQLWFMTFATCQLISKWSVRADIHSGSWSDSHLPLLQGCSPLVEARWVDNGTCALWWRNNQEFGSCILCWGFSSGLFFFFSDERLWICRWVSGVSVEKIKLLLGIL